MLKLAVFPRIFVHVVVWFYPRFKFYIPLFLSMLIYNFKTEEIIFKQRKKWIWTNALCCFRENSEMVTGNQGSVVVAQYLACSRRSDSRAREQNSRRKKNEGRLGGERPPSSPLVPPPPPPLRFPGVKLNSLPTYRRALLSERLEQSI